MNWQGSAAIITSSSDHGQKEYGKLPERECSKVSPRSVWDNVTAKRSELSRDSTCNLRAE